MNAHSPPLERESPCSGLKGHTKAGAGGPKPACESGVSFAEEEAYQATGEGSHLGRKEEPGPSPGGMEEMGL